MDIDNKFGKRTLYLPLRLAVLYSLFTVFLYKYGIKQYPTQNETILYLFLFGVHLLLVLGYVFGIKTKFKKTNKCYLKDGNSIILSFYKRCLFISLLTFLPEFIIYSGVYYMNINEIINRIIVGLGNPAANYQEGIVFIPNKYWSIINYIIVITSFYRWAFMPLTILLWEKTLKSQRVIAIIILMVEIFKWLIKGTNKGIFDIVIMLTISILIIKHNDTIHTANLNKKKGHIKTRIKRKRLGVFPIVLIILMLIFSLNFFTKNIVGRYFGKLPERNINYDSVFYKYTPVFLRDTVISFTDYLVQGYYGLSLSFNLPFESTFGIGNSIFVMSNVQKLTGLNIMRRTYQYKVEQHYGWSALGNWHTAYLWFANDVSFIGVLIVMFLIGYLFASVWKSFITYRNPFSFLLILLLSMFFFYISANNQVFSHFQTLIPFWVFLFKWIKTHEQYIW